MNQTSEFECHNECRGMNKPPIGNKLFRLLQFELDKMNSKQTEKLDEFRIKNDENKVINFIGKQRLKYFHMSNGQKTRLSFCCFFSSSEPK